MFLYTAANLQPHPSSRRRSKKTDKIHLMTNNGSDTIRNIFDQHA